MSSRAARVCADSFRPALTTRTAVVILIETGLRSIDCLRLPFDPVTTNEAGAPYLTFFNYKLSREAIIPISDRLVAQVRALAHNLLRWATVLGLPASPSAPPGPSVAGCTRSPAG